MNILFVNTVYGTGSTGKIVAQQYKQLQEAGHTCMAAYGRGTAPAHINSYRIGSDKDMYMHALLTRITDRTGLFSTRATKAFLQKIDDFQPDCIYLHNLHGYYLNYELLFQYIKEKGISVVWTLHDCWSFTGHCAYFDYVGCEKWKSGCGSCSQKNSYPASMLCDFSKENYKRKKNSFTNVKDMTVIVPSKWLEGLVKQSFLKEYPVKVVYNEVDTEVFKPCENKIREVYHVGNKKLLLGVANVWEKRKGLEDFIKLTDMLEEELYQIILIGLNQKQIKEMPESVIALERTESAAKLAQFYTAADYFLNLTYEDNYPTTNVEARACGTTVLTYRTGGSVECADIVVEKGDLEAVRREVCR